MFMLISLVKESQIFKRRNIFNKNNLRKGYGGVFQGGIFLGGVFVRGIHRGGI